MWWYHILTRLAQFKLIWNLKCGHRQKSHHTFMRSTWNTSRQSMTLASKYLQKSKVHTFTCWQIFIECSITVTTTTITTTTTTTTTPPKTTTTEATTKRTKRTTTTKPPQQQHSTHSLFYNYVISKIKLKRQKRKTI